MDASDGRTGAGYLRDGVPTAVVRGFEVLLLWQSRANQRHALAHLDDRMLRDLGLSRAEAVWESRKPFWRA
ncbi:MAG: DUF1127 domain-containing protein [Alphaproteobacteria bacterium]|nr:DUF1127 domain-containing protein [Alphaproteobacteria bacterium]